MAELVVYGATAAGVCAAVAAARHGVAVTLLEPGRHVGGMVSGGLGYTDIGDPRVIGGMAAEFRAAVAAHYGTGRYAGPEPRVAEQIFTRWLTEAGVGVVFDAALPEMSDAAVYVDASYEGDLLAAAGVSYRVGRESRSLHGESFAGRTEPAPGKHQFAPYLNPFSASGELLPLIDPGVEAPVGEGDGRVMAYGYRVCLSTADDRIPFTRRDGYREEEWELARRWLALGSPGDVVGLVRNLPNGKCDGNSIGPLSLNLLDGTHQDYPTATPARRAEIVRRFQEYTQDFLYFMATRGALDGWGWAADEFDGGLPHQLYVREARRMVGEYVLTQHDLGPAPRYDAVAMGSYHMDIREVRRTWRWVYEHPDPIPSVYNEGYLSVPVQPYQIPYRSLVPRYSECQNLLVPVCVSASHLAFSSVRMEPQYEMLGHAAGLAAVQALKKGVAVQRIDVAELQDRLRDEGQVLAL
ncbi:FAD-dependent oxidoreductase [Actinophytocola sp. NPDC049390]|uniref:FAD-dependent oxidoreductase n=1 Tax=Actinophytocola sp. NPDC049390 TaxID=3363894 RepID=UPI003792D6A0